MKKLMLFFMLSGFVLFLTPPTYAQVHPTGYQGPNEATIFELESDNIAEVAAAIISHMESFSHIAAIPSLSVVMDFLSAPFNSPTFGYDDLGCPLPGVSVYNNQGSVISFRFNNLAERTNTNLFVGLLNYEGGNTRSSFLVYGESGSEGIDFPAQEVQENIIMVGSLCNDCLLHPSDQCVSKLEILIIDKNIL